jgi:Spy/CpxP family protein refolding chaperone
MNKTTYIACTAALLITGISHAQQLTSDQSAELVEISQSFSQQATVFESLMKSRLTELAIELQREDRLDNEAKAKEASDHVNAIMTDLGNLYGEYIKSKVDFVLKAKNVLTPEQKMQLLSQLQPSQSMPYETITYLQPDIFDLPLNLTIEQEKKIIALEAALLKKEVDIESKIEMTLLDLRVLLMEGQPNPAKADPLMRDLADLAAQSINNRVSFFLKSKDVLTLDQKRLLGHMLGLN